MYLTSVTLVERSVTRRFGMSRSSPAGSTAAGLWHSVGTECGGAGSSAQTGFGKTIICDLCICENRLNCA